MSDQQVDAFGLSPVARGRTALPGKVRAAGVLGCCALAVGGLTWAAWPRQAREPQQATADVRFSMGAEMPDRPMRLAAQEPVVPAPSTTPPPSGERVPAPSSVPVVPRIAALGFWEDAQAMQQVQQQREAVRAAAFAPSAAADPNVATPGGGSEYAQRMQTTTFANSTPTPPRFHVHYTIKKGTTFPCTPSQPISSALPGPVQCSVDQNVWSMDGSTILLPRGTQVNGSVERGLGNGEQRLFLVWTDALTPLPDLQAIPLDAPAADALGQTGVPGDVNAHLWKRIQSALLLSLIDIGGNAVTAAAQRGNGNTNLNLGGLSGQATSLGQIALGRDISIPPTLYRGPGQPLTVYVNKYIDLVKYYQNVPRR